MRWTGSRWRRRLAAAVVLASVITLAPDGLLAAAAPGRPGSPAVAPAKRAAADIPPGFSVVGLDVSNHQGVIDWSQVAASGMRFVYAKATEGVHYTDPYFVANNSGAKANGLYVGAYHYALPDRSTGRQQADYFLDRAQFTNDGRTLPPMLDIEWPWEGSGSEYPCYGLSPAQLVAWIHDFVDRVRERTGRPTMIYTNYFWWNPCTGTDTTFADQPLFVARYTATPGPMPGGWTDFTAWQFTSSATIPGIAGRVDQNVFNGSLSDLARLANSQVPRRLGDFNGDGHDEFAVWRPSTGTWWVAYSGGGFAVVQWGLPGDLPLVGDIDGDRRDDYIVWRPGSGTWWVRYANGGTLSNVQWGQSTDVPVVGDFDGDGRDDLSVWRPSTGVWWIRYSRGGTTSVQWGLPGDIPLVGDFNGDGRADFVVWRPSSWTWWVRYSNGAGVINNFRWGLPGDVPLVGNLGGDSRADFVVWRASDRNWYVSYSSGSQSVLQWGEPGDAPLLGQIGGDARDDLVVWRPNGATWWVRLTDFSGYIWGYPWGVATDVPL